MSDQKDFIRAEASKHRNNLQIHPDWAEQAAGHFMQSIKPRGDQVVSVYFPKGKELDTQPLVEKLWATGAACALPVIGEEVAELKFARWSQGANLKDGPFHIPEPEHKDWVEPDIVVVPLLVFDQRGHRVGYGKGHYDATLQALRQKKPVIAVGYAYAEQACLFALPTEPHDQGLDFVVTPQRVFDFRR